MLDGRGVMSNILDPSLATSVSPCWRYHLPSLPPNLAPVTHTPDTQSYVSMLCVVHTLTAMLNLVEAFRHVAFMNLVPRQSYHLVHPDVPWATKHDLTILSSR